MKRVSAFSWIFVVTILAVRAWVLLFPLRKLVIDGVLVHHLWVGVALAGLSYLVPRRPWVLAIGLALIADEFVYAILGFGPVSAYWSPYALVGTAVSALLVLSFRARILNSLT